MKGKMDLSKFRKPTEYEIMQVSKSMENHYSYTSKFGKYSSVILSVVGVFLLTNLVNKESGVAIFSSICSIICFLLVYRMVKRKKDAARELREYQKGQFLVLDGYVEKVERSSDMPGCYNVWFISDDNAYKSPCHSVRMEHVQKGSKLLLVQPNSAGIKSGHASVFTEFMLTDEGVKLKRY